MYNLQFKDYKKLFLKTNTADFNDNTILNYQFKNEKFNNLLKIKEQSKSINNKLKLPLK